MTANERDDAPRDVVAEARALLVELDRAALAIPPVTVSFAGPNLRHLLRALADECERLRAERDAADTSHATLLSMYNALHAERDALRELAQRQAARIAELEKHVPDMRWNPPQASGL